MQSTEEQDSVNFPGSANDSPVSSLPTLTLARLDNFPTGRLAAEPMSSGFTSPAAAVLGPEHGVSMDVSMTASICSSKKPSRPHDALDRSSDELLTSSYGIPLSFPMSERELEQRLGDTNISSIDAWLNTVLDECLSVHPAFAREEDMQIQEGRQSPSPIDSSPITGRCGKPKLPKWPVDVPRSGVSMPLHGPASEEGSNKENEQPSANFMLTSLSQRNTKSHLTKAFIASTHPLLALAKRSQETPIQHDPSLKHSLTPISSTGTGHRIPTHRSFSDTLKAFSLCLLVERNSKPPPQLVLLPARLILK